MRSGTGSSSLESETGSSDSFLDSFLALIKGVSWGEVCTKLFLNQRTYHLTTMEFPEPDIDGWR